jgi:phosphoheptose isomerase
VARCLRARSYVIARAQQISAACDVRATDAESAEVSQAIVRALRRGGRVLVAGLTADWAPYPVLAVGGACEIEAHGSPGDVLMVVALGSRAGSSAVAAGRRRAMTIVALTDEPRGSVARLADIVVPLPRGTVDAS